MWVGGLMTHYCKIHFSNFIFSTDINTVKSQISPYNNSYILASTVLLILMQQFSTVTRLSGLCLAKLNNIKKKSLIIATNHTVQRWPMQHPSQGLQRCSLICLWCKSKLRWQEYDCSQAKWRHFWLYFLCTWWNFVKLSDLSVMGQWTAMWLRQ